MGLSVYRRHVKSCGKTSRSYRRCSCPIWVQGTLAGEKIHTALDLTSLEAAGELVHQWREAGKIGVEGRKRLSVKEAVEKFLADCRARDLAEQTVELYENFLENHLVPWCEASGNTDLRRLRVASTARRGSGLLRRLRAE